MEKPLHIDINVAKEVGIKLFKWLKLKQYNVKWFNADIYDNDDTVSYSDALVIYVCDKRGYVAMRCLANVSALAEKCCHERKQTTVSKALAICVMIHFNEAYDDTSIINNLYVGKTLANEFGPIKGCTFEELALNLDMQLAPIEIINKERNS